MRWNSAVGSRRRAARSPRGSSSPTAKRSCDTSSSRRACASSRFGRAARWRRSRHGCARGGACRCASSWSSTRNWRRCSRPGCRWSSRSTSCGSASSNPLFRAVLDDIYERVRAGTALSEAFAAHGDVVSGRLHGLADGGGEERQPRAGAAALRRLREDRVGRQAPHASRRSSTRRSCSRSPRWSSSHHRAEGGARSSRTSTTRSTRELPLIDAGHRRRCRRSCGASCWLIVLALVAAVAAARGRWLRRPGAARAVRRAGCCGCRCVGPTARKFATSQLARTLGDAARRRHPAGERDRDRRAVDRQPLHGRRPWRCVGQRVREGESFAGALDAPAGVPATWR